MIDIARLDRLRRHLRENPKYHSQRMIACGTTACAAGWTVALEYDAVVGTDIHVFLYSNLLSPGDCVSDHAQRLLGLADEEAEALFFATLGASYTNSEQAALELIDALINREKSELSEHDILILEYYHLPTETTDEVSE